MVCVCVCFHVLGSSKRVADHVCIVRGFNCSDKYAWLLQFGYRRIPVANETVARPIGIHLFSMFVGGGGAGSIVVVVGLEKVVRVCVAAFIPKCWCLKHLA